MSPHQLDLRLPSHTDIYHTTGLCLDTYVYIHEHIQGQCRTIPNLLDSLWELRKLTLRPAPTPCNSLLGNWSVHKIKRGPVCQLTALIQVFMCTSTERHPEFHRSSVMKSLLQYKTQIIYLIHVSQRRLHINAFIPAKYWNNYSMNINRGSSAGWCNYHGESQETQQDSARCLKFVSV